jgi:hypothetical protein
MGRRSFIIVNASLNSVTVSEGKIIKRTRRVERKGGKNNRIKNFGLKTD